MTTLDHEMILASAGSGKTYALTNRVVRLLALGAPPERIVALTFTRKAAGEFFDVILRKLARAAADASEAERLARDIGVAEQAQADFLRLLRAMIDAMPRLSFGTFDAFFARIVRSFPLELGLAGDFELLEEHATLLHRRRVLRRMFARAPGRDGPDAAQRVFIEAFKQATHGIEQKSVESLLAAYLDRHQEVYLETPDGDLWGNPARIWPQGCPWQLSTDGEALTRAGLALRARLAARTDLTDKQRDRLDLFLDELATWTPNVPLPASAGTPIANTLKAWDALVAGGGEVRVERRPVRFEGDDAAALVALVRAVFGAELRRRLETTRGLHAVLANYEEVYNQAVRRTGLLNFADVQRLLAPDADAPALAFEESADEEDRAMRRLALDWRLDARFDHWLLDEFQDTSRGQWSVLRNLIDEVVQDDSGRRSFFFVGDAKQAIYAWREGDARLMREIADHYNCGATPRIVEKPLHRSWRSAPPLLTLVNRVFGAHDVLEDLLSGEVAQRWRREWAEHTPAKPGLPGHAAWIHAEDEDARFRRALDILLEIRPSERGLTSAVLVQKNDTATRLANFLRHEGGLPAVAEADLHVCVDNPLSTALLALVQTAAHPGDTLAWHHVWMTPLGAALRERGLETRDAIAEHVLGQIHREGYEQAVNTWVDALEAHLEGDDVFSRTRGRQMTEAARAFDATGAREVPEFLQFMQRYKVREPESAGVVRVMTIHKSKGLGFDVVVLPDLEGNSIDERREGLAVQRADDRAPLWVLDLPARIFAENDPALRRYVDGAKADACYDKLALLYVAMTRAKQGLYLITKPCGSSSSRNYPRILESVLGCETESIAVGALTLAGPFSAGEPAWFSAIEAAPAPDTARPVPALRSADAIPAPRRLALTPSRRAEGTLSARTMFSAPGDEDAAAFGSAVHALLASVLWWEEALADMWIAARRGASHGEAAIAEALTCLRGAGSRDVFVAPSDGSAEVWRERSFEIILDEAWVTGVLDRVLVVRDERGRIARVVVYDFKTDRVCDTADTAREWRARYAAQMQLYRRAVAVLTGASLDRVRAVLVPTAGTIPPIDIAP